MLKNKFQIYCHCNRLIREKNPLICLLYVKSTKIHTLTVKRQQLALNQCVCTSILYLMLD